MAPFKRRSYLPWIRGAIALAIIIVVGLEARELPWREDFSEGLPARVFEMALGQPPPPGVTRIQAAGRHFFIKRWVWLRFQATDAAMRSLTALGEPLSEAETYQRLQEQWSADSRYDAIDLQKVGWSDTAHLVRPVAYEYFNNKGHEWLWRGILLFDYPNHTVYVRAVGD